VNDTQCSSSTTTLEGGCTWIYETNDETNTSGSCLSKDRTDINCESINRNIQCGEGGLITELSGECTWIYEKNVVSNTDGSCVRKDNEDITCEYINRMNQCENGGGITILNERCGIYDGLCKLLCSEVDETTCNTRNELNDCYWLKGNGTTNPSRCLNRVCFFDFTYYVK
jgi:hypothetical protein